MEIRNLITEFCKTRPNANIVVGYGSEVKKQDNDTGLEKQIDLILGVNDVDYWHKLNYEMNPNDYQCIIGYKLLPLYKNLGTKINYLSYLPFEGHMFKIGIVETYDLTNDLIYWNNFFLAGRFQKPIEIIKGSDELDLAIQLNRLNALKTALLASGKTTITEQELYEKISSLSFIGDWRQTLHIENKNKVANIVNGTFDEFKFIYDRFINQYCDIDSNNQLLIDYERLLNKLDTLPIELKTKIIDFLPFKANSSDYLKKLQDIIMKYFISMNIITSAAQPFKGFALNGFCKTLTYFNQKIEKK